MTKRNSINLFRSIIGIPKKKKTKPKKRSVINRKSSLYSQRKGKSHALRKRPLTEFEKGLIDAKKLTSSWNSQPNPPKVYVDNTRIHHGEVGVVLGLTGVFTNNERLTGLGTGLALDDIDDLPEWFTFKKRDNFSGYV